MADQQYGMLPEGFVIPTPAELRDKFDAGMRAKFGASLPLGDYSLAGHCNAIVAEQVGLCWEGTEAAYSAQDVDKARDAAQDSVCALTGTFRPDAVSSRVLETIVGDPGTVVGAGFTVATLSTGFTFVTVATGPGPAAPVIGALADWAPSTNYALGARVTNEGNAYVCIAAGVSDVAGGPTTNAPDILDGGAHWKFLGIGTGAVDVYMDSEETGEITAIAGDLTDIRTPAGGVNAAINLSDAVLGRDRGTDMELALLRESELASSDGGPADAVRASILRKVPGVTSCHVFFNTSDTVDADGVLPHSCECLVEGGEDQDVIDAIWRSVPLGIRTVGTTTGFSVDDEGFDQVVKFTRPDPVDIYVDVTLTKIAKSYGGDALVQSTIGGAGQVARGIGDDAVASMIAAWVFGGVPELNPDITGVPGVKDITSVKIGLAPGPVSSATIAITPRQRPRFDSGRVTVHSTDDTP